MKLLKHRKDIPGICVCSKKAQTLSPVTSRSTHIESRSAQVFALEPFLASVGYSFSVSPSSRSVDSLIEGMKAKVPS